jgi:hypothetical protein
VGWSEQESEPYKGRDERFRVVANGAFEPLARFGRKTAGRGFVQFLGMLMRRLAQEANLFSVAAAPFAQLAIGHW